MPLTNPEAVLQRVADALNVDVTTLTTKQPRWVSLAAQSTKDAIADLTSILALAGFSSGQIQNADQGAVWVERIAFVICMERGTVLGNYSLDGIKELDPREALRKAKAILIGGVPVAPDGTSQVGGVSSGTLSAYEAERCASEKWFR